MSGIYAGICVGGPWRGEIRANSEKAMYCYVAPEVGYYSDVAAVPEELQVQRILYTFRPVGRSGAWAPHDWTDDTVMSELADAYRVYWKNRP